MTAMAKPIMRFAAVQTRSSGKARTTRPKPSTGSNQATNPCRTITTVTEKLTSQFGANRMATGISAKAAIINSDKKVGEQQAIFPFPLFIADKIGIDRVRFRFQVVITFQYC